MPRACVIVLDAVGAGELPDAAEFGDEGSNTLGNVAKAVGGLYSLKNSGESAYVTDDGQNVIVTPEDPDSSTLTTLRSCTK